MKKYTYEVEVEVPTTRTVIVEAHDEDEAHTLGVKEACALVGGHTEYAHVERITVIEDEGDE